MTATAHTTVAQHARGALALLRQHGWYQGEQVDAHAHPPRNCLGTALVSACGYRNYWGTEGAALQILMSEYGPRNILNGVVGWNDEPGRTFAEVEAVLEKMIASEE